MRYKLVDQFGNDLFDGRTFDNFEKVLNFVKRAKVVNATIRDMVSSKDTKFVNLKLAEKEKINGSEFLGFPQVA